jgi:bifunctional DNA-binding transcriptional regulator/antitoxin component of YhaV-PrlF toxin-antitoxin module
VTDDGQGLCWGQVRGLPVPRLDRVVPASTTSFHTTTVDDRGRVGARAPLRELGWGSGSELSCQLVDGVVAISPAPSIGYRIGRRGHLRIPAALRRRCRLLPGSRVLVVAYPDRALLEIHPPGSVHTMLERRQWSGS